MERNFTGMNFSNLVSWFTYFQLVRRLEGIQPENGQSVVLESQLLQDLKGCALLQTSDYDAASETLSNVASYVSTVFTF